MRWFWQLVPHRHTPADEAVLWGTTTVKVERYCTRCLMPLAVTLRSQTPEALVPEPGTPLEQVQAIAETVETWARQVREVDDEPKVHVLSIERGVSELFTVGDLFDILALALRGVESDISTKDEP